MIAALLVSALAWAATPIPVIYDKGSPQGALERVNAELGEAAAGVTLIPEQPGNLLSGPPQVIGGGETERCKTTAQGADDAEGVPASLFEARAAEVGELVRAGEFERALLTARTAELLLPCLREVVQRETVRDFYAYWGAAASRQAASFATVHPERSGNYRGDAIRAYEAWRRFIPDERELARRADAIGTPDGRQIALNVINARSPSTSFQVLPDVAALWIDAAPASPGEVHRLLQGRHLIQMRTAPDAPVRSLWVHLNARGSPTLAVPELLPPDLTSWVEDRDRQADLAALLGVLEQGTRLYLVTPSGRVWQGVAGDPTGWESLGATSSRPELGQVGRVTAVSGGALAGAGLLTMGISCAVSRSGQDGTLPWYWCGDEAGSAFQTFRVGQGALLAGAGLFGVGLTLDLVGGARLESRLSVGKTGTGVRIVVTPGLPRASARTTASGASEP